MTLVVSTQGHHHFHKLRVLQPNLVRAGHLPAAFHCELIGFLLVGGHLLKGKLRISTPCSEVRSSSLLHRRLLSICPSVSCVTSLSQVASNRNILMARSTLRSAGSRSSGSTDRSCSALPI